MSSSVDIGRAIDAGRWSGYQKWIVGLTALTIVFDGIDNQLLGVSIPTLMREWGAPRAAFAPVLAFGYAGMMIGGAVAGLAGDRWGRRAALVASMVVFAVMTLITPLAQGTTTLGWLRFLAGLGLGGAIPNAAALAAEFVPIRQRPVAVTLAIVCVPLGATLAGLVGVRLLPSLGWRTLFILGGAIPLAAAGVLPLLLPESPRFLARHPARWPELERALGRMGRPVPPGTRFEDASERAIARVSIGELFTPAFRADTIPLWGAFFSCLLAVYLAFSWLTSLLTGAGFDPGTANTGITAFNLGGVAGALAGGWAIARWGSRAAMLTMTAIAMAGALWLSVTPIAVTSPLAPIVALLAVTGAMINGVQTTMYALAAHIYPTAVRATGVGTAVSFGRTGAILSGYVGAGALEHGYPAFFRLMALAMGVTWLSLAAVRRHVPGAKRTHPHTA